MSTAVRDYSDVTEVPGTRVTREGRAMAYTRYLWAAEHARGRDVLEVACGAGQGLGLLARRAARVVGCDYCHSLAGQAASHYRGRVPILRADAHRLPLRDASFDLVLLFEAIYYLEAPQHFLAEARRVLRPAGTLLVCTANREWAGFAPSPFSRHYFAAGELRQLLATAGFTVDVYGGFADVPPGLRSRLVESLRRLAVRWRLIPRTMKQKEWLKRLFYGPLADVPGELEDDSAAAVRLTPLAAGASATQFKVLYASARLADQQPAL